MLVGMWYRPRPRALPSGLLWPAPTRPLTVDETALATEIFGTSLDLRPVRLTRDSVWSLYAPKALGQHVHLKTSWGHFQGPHLHLSAEGRQTLIHELVHVWQHQNGGHAYIADSLHAQLIGDGYRLAKGLAEGKAWHQLNCEQQATLIEEAFVQGAIDRGPFVVRGIDRTRELRAALIELRAGRGAHFRS